MTWERFLKVYHHYNKNTKVTKHQCQPLLQLYSGVTCTPQNPPIVTVQLNDYM